MNAKQTKLAVDILKSTSRYELGQLSFHTENNERLTVWCNSKNESTCFFAPELAGNFSQFMCHYTFDSVLNKVVLNVF